MTDNPKTLQEQVNLLSEKCRAMSRANIMTFSFLVHTKPSLIPILSDAITVALAFADREAAGNNKDKDFYIFLKSQLKLYKEFLEAPQGNPYLRLVDPETDD